MDYKHLHTIPIPPAKPTHDLIMEDMEYTENIYSILSGISF